MIELAADTPVIIYSRSKGLLPQRETAATPEDVVRTPEGLLPLVFVRDGQWFICLSGEMRPMSENELSEHGAFAGCIRDSTETAVSSQEVAEEWLRRVCSCPSGEAQN